MKRNNAVQLAFVAGAFAFTSLVMGCSKDSVIDELAPFDEELVASGLEAGISADSTYTGNDASSSASGEAGSELSSGTRSARNSSSDKHRLAREKKERDLAARKEKERLNRERKERALAERRERDRLNRERKAKAVAERRERDRRERERRERERSGGGKGSGVASSGSGSSSSGKGSSASSGARTINFNSRSSGAYGYSQAVQDFGSAVYWKAYNSQVSGGKLKATLGKGIVGPSGGAMSRFNVPDSDEYELQFDMMFDHNFEWSKGGKVGFGMMIGDGYTGGGAAASGNGGSARIMWFENKGRVYLKPYLYHKDQPGKWGDDKGLSFPSSGSIQRGTWYTVKMYVKSNTGSMQNGRVRMSVNGTTLIDQAMRWTTNDTQRLIKSISFENFRGGSEAYWGAKTDGDILFDNISIKAL